MTGWWDDGMALAWQWDVCVCGAAGSVLMAVVWRRLFAVQHLSWWEDAVRMHEQRVDEGNGSGWPEGGGMRNGAYILCLRGSRHAATTVCLTARPACRVAHGPAPATITTTVWPGLLP